MNSEYTISIKFEFESKEYSYLLGKFKNKEEAEEFKRTHNCGGIIRKLKKYEEAKDLEGNLIQHHNNIYKQIRF